MRPCFHDLRHTCAGLLIAEGAHQVIQERLGHASIDRRERRIREFMTLVIQCRSGRRVILRKRRVQRDA